MLSGITRLQLYFLFIFEQNIVRLIYIFYFYVLFMCNWIFTVSIDVLQSRLDCFYKIQHASDKNPTGLLNHRSFQNACFSIKKNIQWRLMETLFCTLFNVEGSFQREIFMKTVRVKNLKFVWIFYKEPLNWTLQCQIAEELSDLPELYETIDNINVVVNILLSIQCRDILLNSFMVDTLHMKPLPSSKVGMLNNKLKCVFIISLRINYFPIFVGCPILQAVTCAVIMVLVVPWKNKTASLQWKGLKAVESNNGFKQNI